MLCTHRCRDTNRCVTVPSSPTVSTASAKFHFIVIKIGRTFIKHGFKSIIGIATSGVDTDCQFITFSAGKEIGCSPHQNYQLSAHIPRYRTFGAKKGTSSLLRFKYTFGSWVNHRCWGDYSSAFNIGNGISQRYGQSIVDLHFNLHLWVTRAR